MSSPELFLELLSEHLISPSAAFMRQRIWSVLVQIMACGLFGAKSLSEPVLGDCQ